MGGDGPGSPDASPIRTRPRRTALCQIKLRAYGLSGRTARRTARRPGLAGAPVDVAVRWFLILNSGDAACLVRASSCGPPPPPFFAPCGDHHPGSLGQRCVAGWRAPSGGRRGAGGTVRAAVRSGVWRSWSRSWGPVDLHPARVSAADSSPAGGVGDRFHPGADPSQAFGRWLDA